MTRPADNPFASHRIESLEFVPVGTTWEDLLDRLEQMRYRACILGEQGTGKTTLLEQLSARLESVGRRTCLVLHNAQMPAVPWTAALRDRIILLDGADLLPDWKWQLVKMMSRCASGLIVASHARPLLPVLHECRSSPELLDELRRRLASGDRPLPDAHDQYRRHVGNLREALRECYDCCAGAGAEFARSSACRRA